MIISSKFTRYRRITVLQSKKCYPADRHIYTRVSPWSQDSSYNYRLYFTQRSQQRNKWLRCSFFINCSHFRTDNRITICIYLVDSQFFVCRCDTLDIFDFCYSKFNISSFDVTIGSLCLRQYISITFYKTGYSMWCSISCPCIYRCCSTLECN